MRPAILLALLLLTACASQTAIIDQRTFRCAPGQDIEIHAGLFDPAATGESFGPPMYKVEVANNSHNEVTVTYIRLQPAGSKAIDSNDTVSRTFDQLIPPGKDHLFEIPVNDAWLRSPEFGRRLAQRRFEFSAIVALSNGDSYQCDFETLVQ